MQILTDSHIHALHTDGAISAVGSLTAEQVSGYIEPASMDLPVGPVVYHCNHKLIPSGESIESMLEGHTSHELITITPQVLYKGQTYLIPTLNIDLPDNVGGICSPKSSLGRVDVLIRTLTDHSELYDRVDEGYTGVIWLEVTPQSFNIIVKEGVTLSQVMLYEKSEQTVIDGDSLILSHPDETSLVPTRLDGQCILHVGVGNHPCVGYVARHTDKPIDLQKIGGYDRREFFQELKMDDGTDKIILQKDMFYILPTYENIIIPPHVCVEMVPFSQYVGELRAHYAGFFDPGFGGTKGATGVLEVRPHETLHVRNNQPICMMQAYPLKSAPEKLYAIDNGNTYVHQRGPKLAKYFR